MTAGREPIVEWDLQAYADGLLDRDLARKREVEAWLRERPDDARRISEYRAQNEMILERYGDVLAEPVPERLYQALDHSTTAGGLARAAVVAGVMLASGTLGWWVGHEQGAVSSPSSERLMALLAEAGQSGPVTSVKPASTLGPVQPLGWLSDQITIPLRLPDLTTLGYTHIGKRLIDSRAGQAVELVYARPDGKRVVLLLAPRWEEESSDLQLVERDGLRIAYGFEGPLGYGVAGDLDEDAIREVAEAVRQSWQSVVGVNSAAADVGRDGLMVAPGRSLSPLSPAVREGGGAM